MVHVRKCAVSDEKYITEICYKTGYMGEDLTNLGLFNDKVLFGYLFCVYYVRYETDHCFVAVDSTQNKPVGYVIGAYDTKKQRKHYLLRMGWRILLRLLTVTIWKYPESLRSLLRFSVGADMEFSSFSISDKYPAHLHINIINDYQRMGIGERLIRLFEENAKQHAKGIHLSTTSKNTKAVPFYQRMGYKIAKEKLGSIWRDAPDAVNIIFVKALDRNS